jgi:hypothetical protein
MQVTTSKIGLQTLKENIAFLEKIWTSEEIDFFLQEVEYVIIGLINNRYKNTHNFLKMFILF